MTTTISSPPQWSRRRAEKARRLDQVRSLADGVVLPSERIVEALELLIAPGDRVVLEGNNQKQADFLSRSLAKADPGKLLQREFFVDLHGGCSGDGSRLCLTQPNFGLWQ